MKNEFDVEELVMIKELVEEKMEEIKDNENYKGTRKLLERLSEKLEINRK